MELPMARTAVKRLCSILTGVSLAGASALAQTPQERGWCESEDAVTVDQRIDGCSAVIRAARDKSDKLAEAFNNRGVGYRLKGDYDRAIADYNQAIKLNAKFASAYNNRGVAYDKKGDYDRAILDYDQAIKLRPSAEGYFNRGNAQLGKAHYDRAIDDYNQAIKLKADFAAAFDNRCWARAVVGILKQALADCNEALRLMPNNTATLDSRGFVFLKMTHFDAAVSDYDAALRINPKLAFALYGRGLARLKNEDPSGEADIAAAKTLQADIAEEYARYGMQETR
jgi:tetratricopeptide (TPR) repeat protein